jgi:uncharacterized repeat protein (TIGR01451 family)
LRGCLWAAALFLLPGCGGVTQNPSYFPFLWPTGDIVRTHAKPPGAGYFHDFDPYACRLEVRPLEATAPVQTQHLIIATVYDGDDSPRRKRRVEWLLEGAGNIVEVDESGWFAGRGYKVDNKYAVSYTDFKEHHFSRGNADPNDDFVIRPGQTWCVVTSAVEGDTYVTAYAPEIDNWDKHKVVVTTHWVDAEWRFPPPVVGRAGSPTVFTTQVSRRSGHQPLAGYRVRYRILDGPSALFLPGQAQEEVAVTDLTGNASVSLVQTQASGGVNRISVEIVRPPDPTVPAGTALVIGKGETHMDWQGPQLSLSGTAPPAVPLGSEVAITLAVNNKGQVEAPEMTLRDVVPEGLQFVRAEPPAAQDGNQLIWTLPSLPGGRGHSVQAVFRGTRPGPVSSTATVMTRDGLRDEARATTQVTVPQLAVKVSGPDSAFVDVPVKTEILVSNPGSGTATNVVLTADFDATLEHESKANPLKLPVGTLAAGESKTVPLTLTPRQPGNAMRVRVSATGDGNLSALAQHPITAQKLPLRIEVKGPEKRYQNRPADWKISVGNTGEVVLNNVVVRNQLPPELAFVSASDGARFGNNEVVWMLAALQPNQTRELTVQTTCVRLTPRTRNVALATADPGLQVQAEATIEIDGLPVFNLEVQDTQDPVEVNGRTSYRIDVTNQGTLPGNVDIVAVVPPQMQVLNASSPAGKPRVEGNRLTFPSVASLPPKQRVSYVVEVQAMQAGDARFVVELRSQTLQEPVIGQESTRIYAAGAAPEPTRAEPPISGGAPSAGAGQPRRQ